MKRLSIALLAALLVLPAFSWAARRPKPPVELERLRERYIEANGGARRLAELKSLRLRGVLTLTQADRKIDLLIFKKEPNLYRLVMQNDQGEQVYIFDGQRGWFVTSTDDAKAVTEITNRSLGSMTREAVIPNPIIDPAASTASLEVVGEEVVNDFDCYVVEATYPDGCREQWLIDKYNLYIRTVRTWEDLESPSRLTIPVSFDYVDGILFATEVRTVSELGVSRHLEIEEIDINPDIPDSAFRKPEID